MNEIVKLKKDNYIGMKRPNYFNSNAHTTNLLDKILVLKLILIECRVKRAY